MKGLIGQCPQNFCARTAPDAMWCVRYAASTEMHHSVKNFRSCHVAVTQTEMNPLSLDRECHDCASRRTQSIRKKTEQDNYGVEETEAVVHNRPRRWNQNASSIEKPTTTNVRRKHLATAAAVDRDNEQDNHQGHSYRHTRPRCGRRLRAVYVLRSV